MESPETVTEALQYLQGQGYVDALELRPEGLRFGAIDGCHPYDDVVIDYRFRFEGPSDPADEAIVLGVTCSRWDRKGVVVSAFGPSADADEAALLHALSRPPG